jgi:hypothetical protein
MNKLIIQTLGTFLMGAVVLGMLLFLPAWTLNYWQAWVFIVVFLVSTNAIGVYLSLKNPELLERRKKMGPAAETSIVQKVIISIAILGDFGLLVFSALDHRFGWSQVLPAVSLAGDALVALGFLIDFFVFRENSYGASTIQVVEGQQVISTGLYALVRHPISYVHGSPCNDHRCAARARLMVGPWDYCPECACADHKNPRRGEALEERFTGVYRIRAEGALSSRALPLVNRQAKGLNDREMAGGA